MNDSKISVRYAKALFGAAVENKLLDRVNNDMLFLSEIFKTPEAREFLSNPVIPPSKKRAIFHKMLEGNIEKITMSLVDLVVRNGRESFLPSIARVFIHDTLKYKGITEAVLTAAKPVDAKTRTRITSLVSKEFSTKAELKEVVNPEIIGGFILRVDDNFIDASIRNKLRKVRKGLLGASATE